MIRFECDPVKDAANFRKHGIAFEEALTAFYDEFARIIYDAEHSQDEDRFALLGMSTRLRLLVVCHCYRQNDRVIRVISARRANKKETAEYQRFKS